MKKKFTFNEFLDYTKDIKINSYYETIDDFISLGRHVSTLDIYKKDDIILLSIKVKIRNTRTPFIFLDPFFAITRLNGSSSPEDEILFMRRPVMSSVANRYLQGLLWYCKYTFIPHWLNGVIGVRLLGFKYKNLILKPTHELWSSINLTQTDFYTIRDINSNVFNFDIDSTERRLACINDIQSMINNIIKNKYTNDAII